MARRGGGHGCLCSHFYIVKLLKQQGNLGNEFFNFSFLWQVAGGGHGCLCSHFYIMKLLHCDLRQL